MPGKAILILERPWWTPVENPRRPSVLPFFRGLADLMESFSVYYSHFYDRNSFQRALEDDLTFTREDRLYLYIASHGGGRMIGGSDFYGGMRLTTMLSNLDEVANYNNIEGVLIGSCEIGGNVEDLLELPTGNSIVWLFAYKCSIDWITATLVDLSIFENVTNLRKTDISDREKIINAFAKALKKFNGEYRIGENEEGQVALKDAITLIIQPRGRGNRPRDDTERLIERLRW